MPTSNDMKPDNVFLPEAPAGFLGWFPCGLFLGGPLGWFTGALLCFARRLLLAGCHDSSFRNARNNYRGKMPNVCKGFWGIFFCRETRLKIEQQANNHTNKGRMK